METQKLFYENCHCSHFFGRVLSCAARGQLWAVELDATAFYPAGGGQPGDTGALGGRAVGDTIEEEGRILHLCDGPLEVGSAVEGQLDWARRFHYMQQHTGEHMVSGLLHKRYGCHNTGFHMGADGITIDFDTVIPPEALPEIEAEANRLVWQNIPLHIHTPDPEALKTAVYRTKRALPWPVRLVEVPGVDSCACCGVHCGATGEVGLIKLFSSIPFRGGSRLLMACGGHALELLNTAYSQNKLVSQAFSAKLQETGEAARRMNEVQSQLKFRIGELERKLRLFTAESCRDKGNVIHFEEGLSAASLRDLADAIGEVCGGTAAVFSGNDREGYAFCLVSRTGDLRPLGKELTKALNGKGGGKPGFQQGSLKAEEEEIRRFLAENV